MTDKYVDIHSHALFGVDDGAGSIDESIQMLELARQEGIQTLIATPHYGIENGYAPHVSKIRSNFQALKDLAKVRLPDMQLHLGCELYFASGKVLERVERGEALSMAGTRYLLLEFKEYGGCSESAEHICSSMIAIAKTDWLPILAHAQRYKNFEGKQHLYREMVENGVYLQINAYDLDDRPDDWTKGNTRWLVRHQLAHFIGTDAHRPEHRPPVMRSGVQYLYCNCPADYVNTLVRGNAEKLIAGERVPL